MSGMGVAGMGGGGEGSGGGEVGGVGGVMGGVGCSDTVDVTIDLCLSVVTNAYRVGDTDKKMQDIVYT
jgi:hypothetical protein